MKTLVSGLAVALSIGTLVLASCASNDTPASANPAVTVPETTRLPPAPSTGVARPMGMRGGG